MLHLMLKLNQQCDHRINFIATRKMTKVKVITTLWDPTEHLETEDDMAAYLEAAVEEGDVALVESVLDDIARAKATTG